MDKYDVVDLTPKISDCIKLLQFALIRVQKQDQSYISLVHKTEDILRGISREYNPTII